MRNSMKALFFGLLVAILVFSVGCGTASHHRIIQPIKINTGVYKVMEITEIENYVPQTFNQEMVQELRERIIEGTREWIKREKIKKFVKIIGVPDLTTDASQTDVLVFKPTIIGYEGGSGVKRYFLGYGAGKAVLEMQLDIYKKSDGEKIGSCILTSEALTAGTNVYSPMAQQFAIFAERYL